MRSDAATVFRISPPRRLDAALLALSLVGSLALVALSRWNGSWFGENGPFEMAQIGALLAACLLASRAALVLDGWPGRLAVAIALLSLLVLVRELPRCTSPFYAAGPCLPGETKTFSYLLPLLLWLTLVLRNPAVGPQALRWHDVRRLPRFVRQSLPLALVVALLAIGQFADGRNMPVLEETAELAGYLLLAVAALSGAQAADRQSGHPTTGTDGRAGWPA